MNPVKKHYNLGSMWSQISSPTLYAESTHWNLLHKKPMCTWGHYARKVPQWSQTARHAFESKFTRTLVDCCSWLC